MPKIRKETSNRKTTNDRAKVRKKVKESKRKAKKAAKKNPQWKSRRPKDPGIPNEFPYKDQILAEVAEQRRIAAEEKEKMKSQKKKVLAKARAIARGEPIEDSDPEGEVETENLDVNRGTEDEGDSKTKDKNYLDVGAESIAGLSAQVLSATLRPRPPLPSSDVDSEEEEEDIPVLINRDLPNLKSVLDKADIVLEVLDARDPLAYRSKHIEDLVHEMGKKLLLVVNKIDACPREALVLWSKHLRQQHPTLLFRSASLFLPETHALHVQPQVKKGKGKAKTPVDDAVGADSILTCLSHWAKDKKEKGPLGVAIVGVTNVGKSSLVNSLMKRAAVSVYTLNSSSRGPSTTELAQEVTLDLEGGQKIVFIDTPGLSFSTSDDPADEVTEHDEVNIDNEELKQEKRRAYDILMRSKGRIDKLKDPNPPIAHIVSRANTEDLMLMYNLPAFQKGNSVAFLSGVARVHNLVKKRGELDLTVAARIVLRDWSLGKLSHFTTPPTTSNTFVAPKTALSANSPAASQQVEAVDESEIEQPLLQLYAKDEVIFATVPTRKEKRREAGLVRISSGTVDERKISAENNWTLGDNELGESDDENYDEFEGIGMDLDVDGVPNEDDDDDKDDDDEEDDDDDDEDDGADDNQGNENSKNNAIPPALLLKKHKRKHLPDESIVERPNKRVTFENRQSGRRAKPKLAKESNDKLRKLAQTSNSKSLAESKNKLLAGSTAPADSTKKSKSSSIKVPITTGSDALQAHQSKSKAKVANVSSKRSVVSANEKSGNGPEAYDFGKFF